MPYVVVVRHPDEPTEISVDGAEVTVLSIDLGSRFDVTSHLGPTATGRAEAVEDFARWRHEAANIPPEFSHAAQPVFDAAERIGDTLGEVSWDELLATGLTRDALVAAGFLPGHTWTAE